MQTIHLNDDTRLTGPYAATIGFFDGVHRGHTCLIDQLMQTARERGMASMAVTFDIHPRQVLQPDWRPQLLSTTEDKLRLLGQTGIDRVVVLTFDRRMASLTVGQFMRQVLATQLGVSFLLMGHDNHFGQGGGHSADCYQREGCEAGIDVAWARALSCDGQTVSSSLVRRLLSAGDVERAGRCLGRPYALSGSVVGGQRVGRQLGFPTANMQTDSDTLLVPADGVYAVWASTDDDPRRWPAMTNIGVRPTFDGHRRTLETHIIGFDGNLYGHRLTIDFEARLRDEAHFDTPRQLARQMAADKEHAMNILKTQKR